MPSERPDEAIRIAIPDHSMNLCRAIAAEVSRTEEGFPWDAVYALCKGYIGGMERHIEFTTKLQIDAAMVATPDPIVLRGPASFRQCLLGAWRAAREGRW